MVLGTSLIKEQCISCTCVTGDSISFPKQFCLTQNFTNKQNGEGREEQRMQWHLSCILLYSVLSTNAQMRRMKGDVSPSVRVVKPSKPWVSQKLCNKGQTTQTAIFKNCVHVALKSTATSLLCPWGFCKWACIFSTILWQQFKEF